MICSFWNCNNKIGPPTQKKKKTGLGTFCSHISFKWSHRRISNCFGGTNHPATNHPLTRRISLNGRTNKGVQWNKRDIKKLLHLTDTMAAAVNVKAHLNIYCALNWSVHWICFYSVHSSEAVNCTKEVAEGSPVHNLQLKFTETSPIFLPESWLRCLLWFEAPFNATVTESRHLQVPKKEVNHIMWLSRNKVRSGNLII